MTYIPKSFRQGAFSSASLGSTVQVDDGTGWQTILSVSITVSDKLEVLDISSMSHVGISATNGTVSTLNTRLLRDGEVLDTAGDTAIFSSGQVTNMGFAGYGAVDTPSPGSHTYTFQARVDNGGGVDFVTFDRLTIELDERLS